MSEHVISPATYVIVLAVLLGLTFLTLGASLLEVPGIWHLLIGLIIAACKASLVILFFMHALYSRPVTWLVIAAGVVWMGIMVGLTVQDYFSRNMLGIPGH
jgi:cytochrome c oxidase subunit 4